MRNEMRLKTGLGNFYAIYMENIRWNDSQSENQSKKINP